MTSEQKVKRIERYRRAFWCRNDGRVYRSHDIKDWRIAEAIGQGSRESWAWADAWRRIVAARIASARAEVRRWGNENPSES
jgi:hypothetical protein